MDLERILENINSLKEDQEANLEYLRYCERHNIKNKLVPKKWEILYKFRENNLQCLQITNPNTKDYEDDDELLPCIYWNKSCGKGSNFNLLENLSGSFDYISVCGSNVSDIGVMKTWKLPNIIRLSLYVNKIKDVSPLLSLDLSNVKELTVVDEHVKNIECLLDSNLDPNKVERIWVVYKNNKIKDDFKKKFGEKCGFTYFG